MRRMSLGLVLWAFGASTSMGSLQAGPAPVTRILVCPDTSGSLDRREYQAALEGVVRMVHQLCEGGTVGQLAILPWAVPADSWKTPVWQVQIPVLASSGKKIRLDDASRLFRPSRDRKLKVWQADREAARAAYRKKLDPCLSEFHEALLRCRQGRAPCTAVSAILERCSLEQVSTLVVVITDGKEECARETPPELPPGARTLIVLVPSRDEAVGMAREDREAHLEAIAPWALVVPSFELADPTRQWKAALGLGRPALPGKGSASPGSTFR